MAQQYLTKTGLKTYDERIKTYINDADDALNNALIEKINGVGEDCSENAKEIVDIINLIGTIEGDNTISKLIDGLNGEINDLKTEDIYLRIAINEILGVDSEYGDNIASVSVISEQIKQLQLIIGQEYAGDSDDETIIERLDNLEKYSDKYKPNEDLVSVESLNSEVHGGLGSLTAKEFKSKGYTYSEMFDEILFPTIMPVMTEPSLTWKDGFITEHDELVGSDISKLILTDDNVESYLDVNYGSWSLDINNIMKASDGRSDIVLEPQEKINSMPPSKISYRAKTIFYSGKDPQNNKGVTCVGYNYKNNSFKPTYSEYITIYPYYNFDATTNMSSPGELCTQPVKRMAGIEPLETPVEISLAPHSSKYPSQLKLPSYLIDFSILNPLNGKYETVELINNAPKMWTVGEEIMEINGISKTYYLYTYNGPDIDSLNIQITF